MNTIFQRTSVRKFNDKPVAKETLKTILRGGMQAPSAHNTQPWEFLVVTEGKTLNALSKMSPYAAPLTSAAAAIIVLGNTHAAAKTLQWLPQDLSACTQNILLQITDEGLGAVWLGFYPDEARVEKVKEYFKLPPHILPFSVIALGYEDSATAPKENFDPDKIHFEVY